MIKEKKCKGTGKAKGHGCGELVPVALYGKPNREYGLGKSCKCYSTWLTTTDAGNEIMSKSILTGKKKVAVESKRKHREAKRELNVSGSMKLADIYFSRYIRLKHSLDGNCTCYTCGTVKPIKEVDNGHYLKRERKSTRYHENNCRPQCKTCNGDIKHNGKQAEFRVNLSYEIGEDNVVDLEALGRTSIEANSLFFRTIADKYRKKVNELQKKLKVKIW